MQPAIAKATRYDLRSHSDTRVKRRRHTAAAY